MDERSSGLTLVRPALADRRFAWEGMTAPGIVESMMGPPRFPEQPVPDYDGFCGEWEPHLWTHEDPRLGRMFLIVADGERVGVIGHNDVVVTAAGGIATELDLWLGSADCRGRGYGPAALDRICERLPDLGVELAFLQPTARNPASIRAAEKAGFERVAMPPEEAARFHRTRCDYADSVFLSRRLRGTAAAEVGEVGARYLAAARSSLLRQKALGEAALAQIPDGRLHALPGEGSNSAAVLVKHLSGNMRSRWTDVLTTDGEKPWRRRDAEFEEAGETREELTEIWRTGWSTVIAAVDGLGARDLRRTIRVRGREQSVLQAVLTQIGHYSYHVGQLVYVARLLVGASWKTLSIAKGESARYDEEMGYRP